MSNLTDMTVAVVLLYWTSKDLLVRDISDDEMVPKFQCDTRLFSGANYEQITINCLEAISRTNFRLEQCSTMPTIFDVQDAHKPVMFNGVKIARVAAIDITCGQEQMPNYQQVDLMTAYINSIFHQNSNEYITPSDLIINNVCSVTIARNGEGGDLVTGQLVRDTA